VSRRWEKRHLGLATASALVVGNMVGSGVFTTSGFALADLGDPRLVLLAWGVGGVIALCGALSYGGLAVRVPRSGGEYTFLSEVLHPAAGFLAGWVSLLAGFTAPIALAALVFATYLESALGSELHAAWVATGSVGLFAGLHGLRLREGVGLQNAIIALKLLALVAFCGFAASRGSAWPQAPDPTATDGFPVIAFATSLVWISFSFSGWNGAVYLAGEIRDPQRNLPRALWIPTLGVTCLYLALNAVFLAAGPADTLAGRPDIAAIAALHLGGPALQRALSVVICIALLTSVSAMVMSGPRVYAEMAKDGWLPAFLARGADAPTAAVFLQGALAIAVVWVADLAELLSYLGFTLSLSAALTVAAAVRVRMREGARAVPIPAYPLPPLLFIAFTLGAAGFMVAREPGPAAIGLLTGLSGLILYRAAPRFRSGSRPG
jgi:APA family basic amino acid/polyamine antiporter